MDGIIDDLKIAQRGTSEGRLEQFVEQAVTAFATKTTAYLDSLRAFIDSGAENIRQAELPYAATSIARSTHGQPRNNNSTIC